MALLAMFAAVAAPMLGRSTRARVIESELRRLAALLDRARDEAALRAVPVRAWLDTETRRAGWETLPGFGVETADPTPLRLRDDLHWSISDAPERAAGARFALAIFDPDGAPADDHAAVVTASDARGNVCRLRLADDAWRFEIVAEPSL